MSLFKKIDKDKVTLKQFKDMIRKKQAKMKELKREVAEITEWSKEFKDFADEFKDEEL